MQDTQYLDGFIGELLHINEVSDNKLIDLGASGGVGTYLLEHTCVDQSAYTLGVVADRIGKTGNTILLNSAPAGGEQRVNRHINTFEWHGWDGLTDVKGLHAFIATARKDLIARGNNPLFLSVGALKWRVTVKDRGKDVSKDITSPVLIFPVKLLAGGNSSPVTIEFINDDVYVNPCLIAKITQVYGRELADGFPKPNGEGSDLGAPVNLESLGDGAAYFKAMSDYVYSCNHSDGTDADETVFEFDKDVIAVAQYKHDELCTYYDIRRNKEKIYNHPLVNKLFTKSSPDVAASGGAVIPKYILPRDSVQENIISRVANGQSLIIKGPPGTGKTWTIANMIAALMAENKRVIFASKKISALNEVYAKLPERLRKFTMLLDCETEKNAANIRPEVIKQDFKRLLTGKREYKEPAQLSADLDQANAEKAKNMRLLSLYIELMFKGKPIAEDSFYAAIDAYCRCDLPEIAFAPEEDALKITRAQYNALSSQAGEAERHYDVLSANGAHPVYKSPWFGIDVSCNTEEALKSCVKIGSDADAALGRLKSALEDYSLNADGFTLATIYHTAGCSLTEKEISDVLAETDAETSAAETRKLLDAYRACFDGVTEKNFFLKDGDDVDGVMKGWKGIGANGSLTLGQLELIKNNAYVFYMQDGSFMDGEALLKLSELVGEICDLDGKMQACVNRSQEVFKRDLTEEEKKSVLGAGEVFSAYFSDCPEKPKALDFKAKKIYAKLCGLSYLSSPTFRETVKAVEEYCNAGKLQREIDARTEIIYKCFRRQLTDENLKCAVTVAVKCADIKEARAFVEAAASDCDFILKCKERITVNKKGEITVGELAKGYECEYARILLARKLSEYPIKSDFGGREEETAEGLCAVAEFARECKRRRFALDGVCKAITAIRGSAGLRESILSVVDGLQDFGKRFFRNYYVICGEDNTFGDLNILIDEAGDRDVLAAAVAYSAIKNNPLNALPLADFLYYFEKNGKNLPDGLTFKDAFEHSFFALAIKAEDEKIGLLRNGMGNYVTGYLDKLRSADAKICECNTRLIESKCFARIDADDNDFIFVQDRNPTENLRLMFKRHGEAVLKLKKCMILSPYTASLLFSTEVFDDFDVLIIDEASQLEPALALPVLFRSKQCVIVGDEWQMPPIKHFVTLAPAQDNDDEESYASLEPEISVLGLALRNEGFPVEELICHYRSKTETLIKFSQRSFYPNMRTFPAPVPARTPSVGREGLGLFDVYVPEGFVSAGRNEPEADKVVEELKKHFDNYYDEETHVLSMSVGVIAFGEAQCELIRNKVRADAKLYDQIRSASEHYDDLPEKLIFFKTIETVQGQEVGHVILSVTHGKRENGLYMHFGQLNQGKLGRCIFNVAVTRAQCMVTVVHSVRAAEITNESVAYIREYLETVERFASLGRDQFVCEDPGRGFLNDVARFVRSQGIDESRIVFNYGVTDGSVRIPVAVLNEDLSAALLGIWCEKPVGGKYDYLDYNMRYKRSLEERGWKLHYVSAHDWIDNRQSEQEALKKALTSAGVK